MTLHQHLDPAECPKRILALDGGGVKGILTLGMLEVLETELRRRARNPSLVLSDYFDLIGGTSTGAIIAAGLALGLPTSTLVEHYASLGPKVFGKTKSDGLVMGSRFDSKALRKALELILGDLTLGSQEIKTGLAVHAKRIDSGSPWVLTNNPSAPYYDLPIDPDYGAVKPAFRLSEVFERRTHKERDIPNKNYPLIDVVMASAAAPTFFDEVKIQRATQGRTKLYAYFVDGAVGGFNNPSVQMLLTALVPEYGFAWKSGEKNLMLASFGTGSRRPTIDGQKFANQQPALRGIGALRSMIYDTQVQSIALLQAMSNPAKPWRINSEINGLERGVIGPEPLLDFQRVDVELERKRKPRRGESPAQNSIERLLDTTLDIKTLESVDQLSNGAPENMQLLLEIGRKAAPSFIHSGYPNPNFDLPEWRDT